MSAVHQASNVLPPYDKGEDDDFRVKKIASTTTHAATSLPRTWTGKYVTLYTAAGNRVHFGFSKNSSAEISTAVAATTAGAQANVGGVVTDTPRQVRVPGPVNSEETMYLIHEAEAADTLYLELSSD